MLLDAIRKGASDLHFEPYEKTYRIRFRIDGILREMVQPRRELAGLLVSRIKVMAKLDIAEKRVPQDGRISLRVGGREVDDQGTVALSKISASALPVGLGSLALRPAVVESAAVAAGTVCDGPRLGIPARASRQHGLKIEGPGIARRITAGLEHLMQRDGFSTIAEAVGSA